MTEQGPTFFIGELAEQRLEEALALAHDRQTEAECGCHLIEYAARVEPLSETDVHAPAPS